MKTKILAFLFLSLFGFYTVMAQEEEQASDTSKSENIKTGWSFGGVPVVAYDTDIGFKYGGLVNFYDYGDGSKYPKYDHSLFFEWSQTTKGSGKTQFLYDSEKLIPGLRTSGEISYLTEKALDFYGFNGYEAYYNADYTNDELSGGDYKSRMFYKNSRNLFRVSGGLQGSIIEDKLKWFSGFAFYHQVLDTVDISSLNDGKAVEDQLPSINGGLFQDYIEWGLIPSDQAEGGNTSILKAGLVYDTRDNEPNPMNGIWTELQFILAPGFLGSGDYGYSRMVLTHRQYFTIIPKTMNFAYRLSYQAKLTGEMPYYMLPFVFNTAPKETRDGLGGAKTMRGILRNRVVGEDFVYANLELRWKMIRTVVLNQNLYIALAGFLDGGMVTGKYELHETVTPDAQTWLNLGADESLHISYGAGLHFALNENFIVTVDYGLANDPRDGNSGMYIGLNFLF
ncbi:MAG: BamA/TamA family outer membrane protein [Bacteroidales bacterium]|nr:BamA/TamA family outer membrane protein [Bacteroidales bacterium]